MSPPAQGTSETTAVKRKRSEPKFYAVRVGNQPGIYHSWEACLAQVTGHKNALFKSFTSLSDAEYFLAHGLTKNASNSSEPPKFYAVRVGRTPGIYTDWPTAEQQIVGWPKPAYKKFSTQAEAEAFLKADSAVATNKTTQAKKKRKSTGPLFDGDEIDESIEPGTGPLPVGSEDGFDSRIILNSQTGRVEYKTGAQKNAVKMQTTGTSESAMLHVYTDGATPRNGRQGAIAGVGVYFGPQDPRNVSEGLKGPRQTNQRAELTAISRALDIAPRNRNLTIYSDSEYSIKCVTEWFKTWRKNGWMTAGNKPVENKDLVEGILSKLEERARVRAQTHFQWVKGHANNPGNVAADSLAVAGAMQSTLQGNT